MQIIVSIVAATGVVAIAWKKGYLKKLRDRIPRRKKREDDDDLLDR
jgi:hypothetical protein